VTGESGDGRAAVRLERAERIRQIGPDITPGNIQASFGLYASEHEESAGHDPEALFLTRDLEYGPDRRHRLDVRSPDRSGDGAARPVLVFVHGGAYVGGDKHIAGTPYYDNVGAWAAHHGMVGVTMTYRLAPEHTWPAGAQDVGQAVGWVTEHISGYGGDPARVVVAGHSAGAAHVAGYLAGHAGPPAGVAAAALLSGVYDLTTSGTSGRGALYYGADASQYRARSSLTGLVGSGIPVLLAVAELDPPFFHQQAAAVIEAFLRRDGRIPPLAYALGHNHISEIAALGLDDEPLGVALRRFIENLQGIVK
jgi:acetyl esterase/lipase